MLRTRLAKAWVALTLALALHVADEAAHDFLAFYNPFVMSLRDMLLWTWLPTFTFGVWLGGLIAAVAALLSLAWFADFKSRWMAGGAMLYGVLMCGNGLLHVFGSLWLERALPGVWTGPVIAVCGAWLAVEGLRAIRA